MPGEKPPIQTAETRLTELENVAHKLNHHLETVPGAVLGPELRLAVAQCARDGLFDKACAEAQGVCYPKYVRFFDVMYERKYDKPIVASPPSISESTAVCVTAIVHAVVNFQSKLTRDWYDDAVKAIEMCEGLVDKSRYQSGDKQPVDGFHLESDDSRALGMALKEEVRHYLMNS